MGFQGAPDSSSSACHQLSGSGLIAKLWPTQTGNTHPWLQPLCPDHNSNKNHRRTGHTRLKYTGKNKTEHAKLRSKLALKKILHVKVLVKVLGKV